MKFNNVSLLLAFLAVSSLTTAVVSGQTKTAEAPAPAAVDNAPVVTLLEPGEGLKTPLRFQVEKGLTQSVVMEMAMKMSMEVGGQKIPSPEMPAQKMTIDILVTDVDSAGDISYDYKLSKIELVKNENTPPFVAQAMETAMKPLEGMSGSAVVSDRGIMKKTDMRVPKNVTPQVRQAIENMQQSAQQLSTPMPKESVGQGAKWQVVQNVISGGMKMKQTSTFELVSIEGSRAKTKVIVKQEAQAQDIKPPGAPAGLKMRLLGLDSNGMGDNTWDLRGIAPQGSRLDLTSHSKMEVDIGGQKQTMNMEMKMKMKISVAVPTEK